MTTLWWIGLVAVVGALFGGYHRYQGSGRRPPSEAPTQITWTDLTINPYNVDFDVLLEDWRWLVDKSYKPLVISAFGDLFLEGQDGSMYWLDTGMGKLIKVASSPKEFKSLMVQPENSNAWFMPPLVMDLKAKGMNLGPSQCYGWRIPPALGGKAEASNLEITDLQVHFSILGQINSKAKDLPAGTSIRGIKIEEPRH